MMKRKTFITIVFLTVVMLSFAAGASGKTDSGNCGTGLTWTYSDGTLTISGIGSMDDYTQNRTAPWAEYCEQIRTIKVNEGVISIGNYAFFNCSQLSNITLPNNLEKIGANFLYSCSTLSSVTLPDTVTSIGAYAFGRCGQLQNVTLSESLRTIGNCAFEGCTSLTGLSLPDSVNSIGYAAFRETGLRWIRLSINITSMGNSVFESCPDLSEVTWPSSMPNVPAYTFSYDYNPNQITKMILPEGVVTIGEYAFSAATHLKVLYLPLSLKKVNSNAFISCSELTDVYYAGTAEQKKEILISTENSFLSDAVWHYETPSGECSKGIHHLINGECQYCHRTYSTDGLDVIELPSDLIYLKEEALRGVSAQAIIVPAGCELIDSQAFADCPNLRYVFLPENINLTPDALSGTEAELLYQ